MYFNEFFNMCEKCMNDTLCKIEEVYKMITCVWPMLNKTILHLKDWKYLVGACFSYMSQIMFVKEYTPIRIGPGSLETCGNVYVNFF